MSSMPFLRLLSLLALSFVLFSIEFVDAQQESAEMLAKWRKFMESLSPEMRKKFDGLHAEAGKMEQGKLQQRIEAFKAELDPEQKKVYSEIQQRGGGGGRGRGKGNDEDGQQQQRGEEGQQQQDEEAGRGGGGIGDRLEQWIGRTDLAKPTRDALREIKDIYSRQGMDPPAKCERIQRLLKGIGTADKAKLNVPSKLLAMDCREADGGGPQNLLTGIGNGSRG